MDFAKAGLGEGVSGTIEVLRKLARFIECVEADDIHRVLQ